MKFIDVLDTKEDKCLILEFIDGGELFNVVAYHHPELTELRTKKLFKQILNAVNYLHINNVCHRDIKLENILLDKADTIKLTDFGFAKHFKQGELLHARCGSEEYTAPEILQNIPYDGRLVDIWALGVVLFAMLCGELPFNIEHNEKPKQMYHRIARGEFKFPEQSLNLNTDAVGLIRSILQPLAKNRISLLDIIEHKWLHSNKESP